MFAAGDEENIQKLSSFKSTGGGQGEVIDQDTRFAATIRKNIIPNIKLPSGFKIELFAVAPDARHLAISRNKGAVWIGTRKSKVWLSVIGCYGFPQPSILWKARTRLLFL